MILFCFYIGLVFFSLNVFGSENDCIFQDTCYECLATDLNCAWCTDKAYEMRYRCLTREQLLQRGCEKNMILINEPKQETLQNVPLTDFTTFDEKATQVQPQKIFLKLVKSHTQQIEFTYRLAKNNPLDLYVLMDLTWSMRDDKETLVRLGAELSKALSNLTANYRLGFGSYADKPIMPMIMPHLSNNPCASEHATCDPTYSFKHHLSLTEDIGAFVESVNKSRITGNLDNLEGGLDALMQVIVCPEKIGWKDNARKIVLLVTDGYLHMAGDGLLAGIVKPNSKKCHLNDDGDYTASLEYDYPSLEEIYRELLKQKISVIFAVTAPVVDVYHQLSFLMKDISNVEILKADSSNMLEVIKKSYESFTKRTQFNDNSPSYIDLQYFTDCGGKYKNLQNINHCNNMEIGKEVKFYVNVTLNDFPESKNNTFIRIGESNLNQYLDIEVEQQPPCPCMDEKQPDDEYGRIACSDNGFLHCGMCICNENWTGVFCSCPLSGNLTTDAAVENFCREPSASTNELGPVCSNHGICECGKCSCFSGFNGKFCECPVCDLDCDPDRADCYCGECVCKNGWTGDKCDCKESIDECITPSGQICSGRGHCHCGSCVCDSPYKGNFCEIGSGQENMLCSFHEPCVTCLIERKLGQHPKENCKSICALNDEEGVTYAFISDPIDADVSCLVRLKNEDNITCDHYFTYQSLGQLENYLLIQVNRCAPVNYAKLVGLISLTTFILGLLLILLISFCIKLKDEREYARFKEDRGNIVLNENPIYRNPNIKYEVPANFDETTKNPFQ